MGIFATSRAPCLVSSLPAQRAERNINLVLEVRPKYLGVTIMADQAEFGINPPRRCGVRLPTGTSNFCRRPAPWARELHGSALPIAICDLHRAPGDRPCLPDEAYRQVRVTIEAYFAAIAPERGVSQAEAVELLREIVGLEGGIASLVVVSSGVGRPDDPGVVVRARGDGPVV